MRDKYEGFDDRGGVHINSGIPNHAFYLAATELGGHAWETLGPTWYGTLRALSRSSGFDDAARMSVQVAGTLHGAGSPQQEAVGRAWEAVGVGRGGMRIRYRESGGYAGLLRGAEVEAEDLPPDAAAALDALVERGGEPRPEPARAARDQMAYEISVATEGGPVNLRFDDADLPEEALPLLDYLRERAGPRSPEPPPAA
jgi:hypothetical protein